MSKADYDDRQAMEILRRAAELQNERSDTAKTSVADLEEAGMAVGIDRTLIRRAAAEVDAGRPPPNKISPWRGGPTSVNLGFVLPGRLDDARKERVVEAINDTLGEFGRTEQVGRDMHWMTGAQDLAMHASNFSARQIRVSLRGRDDGVHVQIEERFKALASAMFGGVFGGMGGGTVFIPMLPMFLSQLAWAAPVFIAGWLGMFYALARSLYGRKVAQRRAQLEALRDRLLQL